jgi:hypothetical protein
MPMLHLRVTPEAIDMLVAVEHVVASHGSTTLEHKCEFHPPVTRYQT